ncbi:MAG: hypothetical protein IJF66_03090 [Clostridia bacterium]|nr:hypothetical protein [Clostridia bacterium]
MLYFREDRVRWWIRVLAWLALVGLCLLVGTIYPNWVGLSDAVLLLLFVPILFVNLAFPVDKNFCEWMWKLSCLLMTGIGVFYQPTSQFGYGMRLACSLVVILTLIYAIFGNKLVLFASERVAKAYDILTGAVIVVALVISLFVTEIPGLGIPLTIKENNYVIPVDVALYVIALLRYGPLYDMIENIDDKQRGFVHKGGSRNSSYNSSDYSSSSSYSSSRSSSAPQTNCHKCAYHTKTNPRTGLWGGDFCGLTGEPLGYFDMESGCSNYTKGR